MPRHKEFNPDDLLAAAVALFWRQGYKDTSIDQLVAQSGVAKYGIYSSLGSKQEMFRKVLARYAEDRHKDIQAPIRRPGASLADIREFFDGAVERATQPNAPQGCLMVNTALELGKASEEIRAIVDAFFDETTHVMQACLERAAAQGELTPTIPLDRLARYLVGEFRFLLLSAAAGTSRQAMRERLEVALLPIAG